MRIDAHHHFWQMGKYDYVWMSEDMGVLYDSFGPQDLGFVLEANGVDRTIVIQTISSVDETRWFLELAAQNEFIAGVVGWVDLTDPAAGDLADELAVNRSLVGFRHQVHDEPDDSWILRPDVMNGLGELARRGIPYDLLIRPRHLDACTKVARTLGDLPLVVDHIAKPAIAAGTFDGWANEISELAACENVYCKLSGMITEADFDNWKPADLKPYMDHVLNAFGVERCMFGSDWPVCLLAGTYDDVIGAFKQNISELSTAEQDALLGGNASRIYKLEI